MNKKQFKYWWLKPTLALMAVLFIVAACGESNTVSDQGEVEFVVHPTSEVQKVDLTLTWSNSPNIELAEGGTKPGVILRVVNKTGVLFEKAELMYLSGGVLKEFSPMEMEFEIENLLLDKDIVNGMFIKLTSANGDTSTCVIHLIVENTASLSCSGFSAP